MERATLKANAKKSLKGKYWPAILVTIVLGVLIGLPASLASLTSPQAIIENGVVVETSSMNPYQVVALIIAIIFFSLFTLGGFSFFLKIARNRKTEWTEVFSQTSRAVACFLSALLMGIFTFLWSLLLIIPGIIASYRYRQTQFILVDDPKIGPLEAITKSKEMMKGHKMDLFVMDLSFLGWNILAVLTFGLLYFWLAPYMAVSYANFYDALKKEKKQA